MSRASENAVLLLLLAVCGALCAPRPPRLTTTVEFRFEREHCAPGTFTSWAGSSAPQALGTAQRGVNTSACLRQNGLRTNPTVLGSPPLETSPGVSSLSDALVGTTGFALEVWTQLDAAAWANVPVTNPSPSDPLSSLQLLVALQDDTGAYCTGIYLAREELYEVVVYGYMKTYFEGEPACLAVAKFGLEADSTIFSQPTHLVLSARKDVEGETTSWRQQLFVDTERVLETLAPDRIAAPFTAGQGKAIFLGTGQRNIPASLFLFAGYNTAIASSTVTAQYNARLPSSSPAPVFEVLPVPEDGWDPAEKSDEEASNASTYFHPYPAEQLYVVNITWYDYDEDPTSFNYPPPDDAVSSCSLSGIPAADDAQLYSLSGQPIQHGDLPLEGCQFRVRPAWNKANFSFDVEYKLTDGETAVATVNPVQLEVYQVLDPPIADESEDTVRTRVPQCLQLISHVIDGDIADVTYVVVEPPHNGTLYRCSASGEVDFAAPITAFPQDLDHALVGYVHEAPFIGGVDEFTFASRRNGVSTTAVAAAHITTRLELAPRQSCGLDPAAYGSLDPSLYFFLEEGLSLSSEDTYSSVQLQAYDVAQFDTQLDIVFEATPNDVFGNVWVVSDRAVEGMRYPMTGMGDGQFVFPLTFVGAKDFFNYPQHTYYGEPVAGIANSSVCVSYQAKSPTGNVESAMLAQQFVVQNVNDPPILLWSHPANLSVFVSAPTKEQVLNITGFSIEDADRDTDLVHVHVFTAHGRVTVSQAFSEAWELCPASTVCPCTSSIYGDSHGWACQWHEFAKELDFVATPSRASQILNTLQFMSEAVNDKAAIEIEIFDGDGSFDLGCISWKALGDDRVVRNDCFRSAQVIYVQVKSLENEIDVDGESCKIMCELQLIFVGLLILLLCGVLSILNCFRKCTTRLWRCFCRRKKAGQQEEEEAGKGTEQDASNKQQKQQKLKPPAKQRRVEKNKKQKKRNIGDEIDNDVEMGTKSRATTCSHDTIDTAASSICIAAGDPVPAQAVTTSANSPSHSRSKSRSRAQQQSRSGCAAATSARESEESDPEVWEVYTDAQSRTYYYNPTTRESTWRRPASLSTGASWQPVTDPEGRTFFFNLDTRQSSWQIPSAAGGERQI